MKKISVCVPAYNRPHMIEQLIKTFQNQDYPNRELVISDDSDNTNVRNIVTAFKDPTIRYHKNHHNMGYCQNLLISLKSATGDYIIILGDDDLMVSKCCLSIYVEAFNRHEDVVFIYSNLYQISDNLTIDYMYRFFPQDTMFSKCEDAFSNIWLKSLYIAGIGIRNIFNFDELYTKSDILFPQTELIGRIIAKHNAYGISNFLIAGRVHKEQLGFFALRGERIKGEEQHWTTEVYHIFNKLSEEYRFDFNDDFLSRQVINMYSIMILKDKMLAGNKNVRSCYHNLCGLSEAVGKSKRLRIAYLASMIIPASAIRMIRFIFIKLRRIRDRKIIRSSEKYLATILREIS